MQVGDKMCIASYAYGEEKYAYATVKKETPTQWVTETATGYVYRFRKSNLAYVSKVDKFSCPPKLVEITPEIEEWFLKKKLLYYVNVYFHNLQKMKIKDINIETLKKVYSAIFLRENKQ